MMFAWSFAARTFEEVERLLRALGKHRYVKEVDHRLHWTIDAALSTLPAFAPHAAAFEARKAREPELELGSRDPSLWRLATIDEVVLALGALWTPGPEATLLRRRLEERVASLDLPASTHAPFASLPDEPPHPELVMLDWVLLPVDELDAERHAGALAMMEAAEEEVNASAPVYQEGPVLALPELCEGAPNGALLEDFTIWSEPPYSYANYVFLGVSKSAKLVEPPVGLRDLDDE
jgi:hypothetical protein